VRTCRRRWAPRGDMVPDVNAPAIQPGPETRRQLVTMLTQFYSGADEPTEGVDVQFPDALEAIIDLAMMFLAYVGETEAEHGGDFLEFLQRQALEAFGEDDDAPSPGPS
jgi:hypothetical protein